ncbi:BZ3500_MvSof-1268-A1-R1_Chr1-3g01962 [Microbotryum saponariae]|uniref:BZ3500_MvSof-1268-A1-R1_Chr1-3g01962 protein n=1 Tax=Microbotryum saponariae TaxID=289078 RepID=A0A2X0MLA1_9BASI|nr:BZ3500_MvSof-1268-A1-R1_Chr1-3g01962 [Microbotryum saponariae]SCZ95030.1 BZ3501_MvSof-1269-A2-R1_Chr1-3g01564 [Microbotryum saponariae]
MSAYGTITRPSTTSVTPPLEPRSFPLHDQDPSTKRLTVFPLTRSTVPEEMIGYLLGVFNDVLKEGRTYPQMGEQSYEQFVSLNWGRKRWGGAEGWVGKVDWRAWGDGTDCFLGLLDETPFDGTIPENGAYREKGLALDTIRAGREWKDAVVGMYYIKPNYPGRSSHNCNGGFVVPPVHRGLKVGKTLGRSYLHYAPLLGYKASVFNLVYVNNIASVKIWDSLGFQRAGLIPNAGLLKKAEGEGEEYVDAIVFYYNFMKVEA